LSLTIGQANSFEGGVCSCLLAALLATRIASFPPYAVLANPLGISTFCQINSRSCFSLNRCAEAPRRSTLVGRRRQQRPVPSETPPSTTLSDDAAKNEQRRLRLPLTQDPLFGVHLNPNQDTPRRPPETRIQPIGFEKTPGLYSKKSPGTQPSRNQDAGLKRPNERETRSADDNCAPQLSTESTRIHRTEYPLSVPGLHEQRRAHFSPAAAKIAVATSRLQQQDPQTTPSTPLSATKDSIKRRLSWQHEPNPQPDRTVAEALAKFLTSGD
jgi:hypothetical protein